jgi:methylated-DNA-[protein]-cysteine S-methyltransferase
VLDAAGTPFQQAVWRALCAIPAGQTSSYGAIARAIGRPAAVRAVGAAVGRNPISVLVPCHRVLGHGGALTGYAGGLPRKQALLLHEGRQGTLPSTPPEGPSTLVPTGAAVLPA